MTSKASGIFAINQVSLENDLITAQVSIDPSHEVFKGHFPGQPILPGVVITNLIKKLVEKAISKKVQMKSASQIKFIEMVDPRTCSALEIKINIDQSETGEIKASASSEMESGKVHFKMKCVFTETGHA